LPFPEVSAATADWPAGDFSDLLCAMNQTVIRRLRALLALSRVSHLPTVWSNCLAGWWLGGHGNFAKLPLLFLGVSALYTGGMFLNDAFDADFDRQRRTERPIPSGAISLPAVWRWGLGWLGLGALCLTAVGRTTGLLTVVLLLCIIIYDATHKVVTASPWLMGVCRFWVYVIAGSAGAAGVNGGPIWCGAELALYVAGLGYLAHSWPCRSFSRCWSMRRNSAFRQSGCRSCWRCGLRSGCGRFFKRSKPTSGTWCRACLRELFSWTGWRWRRYARNG
jgi:hypothetical protein